MATNPALDVYYEVIDHADLADTTRKKYKRVLKNYLETGATLADVEAFEEYAQALSRTPRADLKTTVRLLGRAFAAQPEDELSQDILFSMRPLLDRLEARRMDRRSPAAEQEEHRIWLSAQEVQWLMGTCGDDLKGYRDWIVLGLMVGAGLRRGEVLRLRFDDISEDPRKGREGTRSIITVRGKGAAARTIPILPLLAERLKRWHEMVGDGLVARSIGRRREVGSSLARTILFGIVRRHGAQIGKLDLTPHDLRYTYAQLGYEAGIPITEISRLLGHSPIVTTQGYLNLEFGEDRTVSDFIPLE